MTAIRNAGWRRAGLLCLGLFTVLVGEAAGVASSAPGEVVPPRLVDHSTALVPMALRPLNLSDPVALAFVRVGRTGEVVDLVVTEASHRGLVAAAERLLRGAEYQPGTLHGEHQIMDLQVKIEFSQPRAVSQSVSDHVAASIERIRPEEPDYVLATPRELDEPLEITSEGTRVMPVDASGDPIQGRALVEFYIDRTGTPRMPEVISSDHEQITVAAITMLEELRFAPPLHDTHPTVVKVRMPFTFAASGVAAGEHE